MHKDEVRHMSEEKQTSNNEQISATKKGKGFLTKYTEFCRYHHFRTSVFTLIVVLVLAVIVLLNVLLFGNKNQEPVAYTTKQIDFGLSDIGELVTQAGYYTNVNTIIKPERTIAGIPIPGTSSKALMTYQGVIRAGVDFSQIQMDVDTENKIVTLHMPAPTILGNEVDMSSCEIYDESNSVFNKIDVNNFNESVQDMQKKSEAQAIDHNILGSARSNAETLIRTMFKQTEGTSEYSLKFVWNEK